MQMYKIPIENYKLVTLVVLVFEPIDTMIDDGFIQRFFFPPCWQVARIMCLSRKRGKEREESRVARG